MTNRIIVSCGFGSPGYIKGIARLAESIAKNFKEAVRFHGIVEEPASAPHHRTNPYAFKPFMVKEAMSQAIHQVLWMDSSCYFIGDVQHYWDLLEHDGLMLIRGGWSNRQWCSDHAANVMQATDSELHADHLAACFMGFDLRKPVARMFLDEWWSYSFGSAFAGTPDISQIASMRTNDHGQCGPNPPILGHRHDQTVASILAARMKIKLHDVESSRFAYASETNTADKLKAEGKLVIARGMA